MPVVSTLTDASNVHTIPSTFVSPAPGAEVDFLTWGRGRRNDKVIYIYEVSMHHSDMYKDAI